MQALFWDGQAERRRKRHTPNLAKGMMDTSNSSDRERSLERGQTGPGFCGGKSVPRSKTRGLFSCHWVDWGPAGPGRVRNRGSLGFCRAKCMHSRLFLLFLAQKQPALTEKCSVLRTDLAVGRAAAFGLVQANVEEF